MLPQVLTATTSNRKRGLRFIPHPGQAQALDSQRRFTFVIAGTQSGKTSFGPIWMVREINQCGPGDYLAVTSTFDLFKLKMLPEMTRLFIANMGWRWLASERVIENPSGSVRIILRSAQSDGGLESATAKAAWLDECGQDDFRLASWEAVQRRLALNQGRVLGTTTPYNQGWLKQQVYDKWRSGDQDYKVIQFKSIMNPIFPRAEYERARRTLPDWKFRMFYDGEFTRPAGMIYSDFDDTLQVISPVELDPGWPRYVGIDFGAVNTALVWIAHNIEKDTYIVYRESLEGGKTTDQHAKAALEIARAENVIVWAGGSKSEVQQRMDWAAAGVGVQEPPISDVEAQIDRVIALMKSRRLFIISNCSGLLDEIGTYSRELDENGQSTEKIKDKDTFHRLDALRYAVLAMSSSPTGGIYV